MSSLRDGYTLTGRLRETPQAALLRGRRRADDRPVLLKAQTILIEADLMVPI